MRRTHKLLTMMSGGGLSLTAKIEAWQSGGSPVYVSGIPVSEYGAGFGSIPTGPAAQTVGYTVLDRAHSARENCNITALSVHVYYIAAPGGQTWKFKTFRWDAGRAAYKCVSSTDFTLAGTGVLNAVQTVTLSTPVPVVEGDITGLYIPIKCAILNGNNYVTGTTGKDKPKTGCVANDVAVDASDAFATTITDLFGAGGVTDYSFPNITTFGHRPYAVFLGDSIVSSGNSSNPLVAGEKWQTDQESVLAYHTPGGSPGNINFSVPYRVSTRMPANFTYQMLSRSGAKWADLVGLQDNRAAATDPKVVFIHCGVNDVNDGVAWSVISGHLDTLRGVFPAGTKFYLDEVLAWRGSDALAAATRSLNANYATYCGVHGWTLVRCHDEMAQMRLSTGELDDLIPAYSNGDSVHLSTDGVDKLAEIISRYVA